MSARDRRGRWIDGNQPGRLRPADLRRRQLVGGNRTLGVTEVDLWVIYLRIRDVTDHPAGRR